MENIEMGNLGGAANVLSPWAKNGRKPRSGRCSCDTATSVKEIRRTSTCLRCGDLGLDLISLGWGKFHARCIVRACGIDVAFGVEAFAKRVRLCCIGKRSMKRLLAAAQAQKL